MPDFPENIVDAVKVGIEGLADFTGGVHRRPLRPIDPHLSAGVFASDWTPEEWQIGQYDPAVTRYRVHIQTLVKHADEEEGIALHSGLAKKVRVMLYRDEPLRVQLGSLSTTESGVTERTQRWGVLAQRYLSNEVNGTLIYFAVTEMWLETEIV